MKKILGYGVVFVLFAIPFLTLAFDFRVGDQPSVKKEEKINNDVYMVGNSVSSVGNIDGDLLVAGGNIIINGDVSEDLFAGGGNVNILSNIGDDVRAGGGIIVIQGRVGGDVVVGGGQVSIGGPGVGGDVMVGGGVVRIDAPIIGNLKIGGGNIYLNAPIKGNIDIQADKLTLGNAAVISGNLNYKAKSELTKEEGAVIKGKVSFEPRKESNISPNALIAVFSVLFLLKFLTLFVCALLLALFIRRYSKEIIVLATERPLYELGKGVLVFVTMPIISIFLLVTIVGIPFGIVGLLGFVVLMIFAWILTPIILGSYIYRYFSKGELEVSWKTVFVGVLVYTLLSLIPVIGWLAKAFLIFVVLGSMADLKLRILKEWR